MVGEEPAGEGGEAMNSIRRLSPRASWPLRSRRSWARLRRDGIGIVFQEFNLIPTLTALENVELALFGRGLSQNRRYTRAAVVLNRVRLESRMHHLVTKLSGGERQRVAIAR